MMLARYPSPRPCSVTVKALRPDYFIKKLICRIISEIYVKLFQELLQKLLQQRHQLRERDAHIADLERYIDELLVKVIDLQPLLLSHDTSPTPPTTPRSTTLQAHQPSTAAASKNRAAAPRPVRSPFLRQSAARQRDVVAQRTRPSLRKFAIGPLQTLLK